MRVESVLAFERRAATWSACGRDAARRAWRHARAMRRPSAARPHAARRAARPRCRSIGCPGTAGRRRRDWPAPPLMARPEAIRTSGRLADGELGTGRAGGGCPPAAAAARGSAADAPALLRRGCRSRRPRRRRASIAARRVDVVRGLRRRRRRSASAGCGSRDVVSTMRPRRCVDDVRRRRPIARPAPLAGAPSCATRFGPFASTCEYSAAGVSVLRRWRGTLACLYSCSASQVVQRVCLTSSPTIATTAWLVSRRSRGQ